MKSDFGSSNSFIKTLKRPIFYGWWLVILTLFLNAVTGVPVFGAVGVWIDALESEFGWSRTQLALAFSLGLKAEINGMAVPTTAPVPTIEVAATKNFLLPGLEGGFGCILSF